MLVFNTDLEKNEYVSTKTFRSTIEVSLLKLVSFF